MTDIRRWVMAMDYANPLHWNDEFAQKTRFGGIVAPQSFAIALDHGHGSQPSVVGKIPGSHLIFGGEEWWFHGPRIFPGDHLRQERIFQGYKISDTRFAGPTMFSYGDTTHFNQRGERVATERASAVRYLASEAEKRGFYGHGPSGEAPTWTPEQRAEVARVRLDWIKSNREGRTPRYEEVGVGDRLPRRAIGPHTVESLTTEYRAFIWNAWGAFQWVAPEGIEDPWVNQDHGWVDGFWYDFELAEIDPRQGDGLYVGPSRGHSYVRHTNSQYRSPAFEGDVTYLDGEVSARRIDAELGVPLVTIAIEMSNQDGSILARGEVEVEVPLEDSR